MNESVIVSVSNNSSGADDIWAWIEQPVPPKESEYASTRDVYQMWIAAVTGKSARTLRPNNCPVEFSGDNITAFLGFYIWPSVPNLQYQLSVSIGTLSPRSPIRKLREYSDFLDNSDTLKLLYYMEEVDISFESPCYNRYGDEIEIPDYSVIDGIYIKFDSPVFCGVRIKGYAIGDYYLTSIAVSKSIVEEEVPLADALEKEHYEKDGEEYFIITPSPKTRLNGYRITNLDCTVSLSWMDDEEQETDQKRLELPQCVKDVLAFCPDMYKTIVLWCEEVSTRQVFYNTCNGELILVRDGKDTQHYCSKISESYDDPGAVRSWIKGTFHV